MSVQATCFHCQQSNTFDNKWAGRVMRCQKCGGILTVPKPDVLPQPAQVAPTNLQAVAQTHAPVHQTTAANQSWAPSAPPAAVGLADAARLRTPITQPIPHKTNGHHNGASNGHTAKTAAKPSQEESTGCGLAITLCTLNGLVMLATAATTIMLALHSTRAMVLAKLHADMPESATNIAWAAAAFTGLLGAFYLLCAAFMQKGSSFARAATYVAIFQTTLQIAALIYMTTNGQLNHISLAAITISFLVLCATIDLSIRASRDPLPTLA